MVKRCIGIDIGFSYLRAVQIMRTEDELCIEKVFSTKTQRSKDSLLEILGQLSGKHGFDLRSDVAISMPHDTVFFRNLETDFAGLEQICQVPNSAVEHNFPIEPAQIVAQVCSHRRLPEDKYSVLTAAVSKTSLHDRLNTVAGAKIHPNLVETTIFALHSTIVTNHPEIATGQAIIAYIDESYLTMAVTENNNILIVRNIPIVSRPGNNTDSIKENAVDLLAREAEVTWQKVFGTNIEEETKIYLAFGGDVSRDLEATVIESLNCKIVKVEPYAEIKCSPEHNCGKAICVAEGLALRALVPEKNLGINFLKAYNTDTKTTLDLRKELIICAVLAAAIIVVSFAGLFIRLFHLESKYTNIKNEIRQVFQNTLPEEKNIVNPLAQLEQQLVSFRKDNQLFASFYPTRLTPLKVLHNITTNTPSESNIRINDLLITTESVRLKGTCDSFDSVYQWQRLLQEIDGFTLVDVQNPQRNPKGDAIHFTILISLDRSPATQEQK